MPALIYRGSFGGVRGGSGVTSTPTVDSSSAVSALPASAVITSVAYTLKITADTVSSSKYWKLDNFNIGSAAGGTPSAAATSASMASTPYYFQGSMSFSATGDVSKFTGSPPTVYAKAYTTHSSSSYLWDYTISIGYVEPGDCTPPKSVTVSPAYVDAGTKATLSWSGATNGDNNAISTYRVYRSTSQFGEYTLLSFHGTSVTSTQVTAPSTAGESYYYKVAVLDTLNGAETMSDAYAVLTAQTYGVCAPPETVALESETAGPNAKVKLFWSGASAGENDTILGYQVHRATSAAGPYESWQAVSTSATSGSHTVTAPSENGATYYYKIQTIGTKTGYTGELSVAYAALMCSYAAVGAPTTIKLGLTNAAPGAEATLSWDGACAGENNPITGYEIYRATGEEGEYSLLDTVTTSATSGSTTVTAPETNGTAYYYKIKTLGTEANSNSELSTAYTALTCTYSSPNAPDQVTLDGVTQCYVAPGTTARLEWDGASAGANNPIVGYDVYRDGVLFAEGLAPETLSLDVDSHGTPGRGYTFSVVAKGAYSDSAKSAQAALYSYTDPTAPTKLTGPDTLPVAGSRLLLSWEGAAPGGYNDIAGYRIYQSASTGGAQLQVAAVDSTDTFGSCYVPAPATAGAYLYYRVATVGTYSTSALSDAVLAVGATEPEEGESGSVEVIVPAATKRKKRGFILGDYDTALHGWTLTGWSFPEPETQTTYVEVPGRIDGPLDQSTVLTGGDPRFNSRPLTITLECSEGTRLDRDALIMKMVNRLTGHREEIVFPDDSTRYAVGRLHVQKEYSDMAHAAVTVTATCEPWRYSRAETHISILALDTEQVAVLYNSGRRVIVPDVDVTGYGANIILTCADKTWTLTTGRYRLPELALPAGNTIIKYRGVGTLNFTYREGII